MHDRVQLTAVEGVLGTVRVSPIGALDVGPPARVRVERHRGARRGENGRPRDELFRRHGRDVLGEWVALRDGEVIGGAHEPGELRIRDLGRVHPETVHVDAVDGTSIR
jgi:hypothetical protein